MVMLAMQSMISLQSMIATCAGIEAGF